MRRRCKRCLHPLLAVVLGACAAAPPALAAPSEARLEVNQNCVDPNWPCWATPGSSQPALVVTIAGGGTVTFIDHDASTAAGVNWIGGSAAPACTGVPTAAMMNWEGKCTFATPGTYRFESPTLFKESGLYGNNDYTKYQVVVEGSATTPPTGTPGGGGAPPGTVTPSPNPAGTGPTGSPLAGAPVIHSSQRGTTVKGSLRIAAAGAGDRLEVDLLATAASLARAGHTTTRMVGQFVSASVSAGRRSFAVKLDAKARRALKRRRRLALQVRITLTPVHGAATSLTKSVTVHA